MEDEKNTLITPRFGILTNEMISNDDTCIKRLINTEKKKHFKYPEIQTPKKGKKNKSPKIKDLNSEKCCKGFLKKKFKLKNDFDHEHTENFLIDKDIALENVELSDNIFE